MDERKDSAIQIRLSRRLHEQFKKKCAEDKTDQAEWIRGKIEKYVKERKE